MQRRMKVVVRSNKGRTANELDVCFMQRLSYDSSRMPLYDRWSIYAHYLNIIDFQ